MKIELEFDEQMKAAVIEGRKCCTFRRVKHGEPGDTFEVGGRTYRILQIVDTEMWLAEVDFCRAAGFADMRAVKEWAVKHWNLKEFDPNMHVFVHFFACVPEEV